MTQPNRFRIDVEPDEFHTIMAALRYYQQQGLGDPAHRPQEIHELATNADEVISLDEGAIDELCERINLEAIAIPTGPAASAGFNRKRSLWADEAVRAFACTTQVGDEEPQTQLADLLTDLMHWVGDHGCDFEAALARAREHFGMETESACKRCRPRFDPGDPDGSSKDECAGCCASQEE